MAVVKTKLHQLRERLTQEFADILREGGDPILDKDGQPVIVEGRVMRERPSPAMLNVIRQHLKDNGIDDDPIEGNFRTVDVNDALPFQEPPRGIPEHLRTAIEEE
jgi:hypothetical protein